MFKNALVSVSDKTGLIEFLKPLVEKGLRVVSTGGTAKYLTENKIPVVDVSEQTQFPEVMGGRVKTLHPHIHMALLARDGVPEDHQLLQSRGLEAFDLLVCNLYPFEEAVRQQAPLAELIEKIDIGGPAMIRAAAKNHSRMTVVCDPRDYQTILSAGENGIEQRRALAAKAFYHVSSYDSLVAKQLGEQWGIDYSWGGHKVMELRYGENPHQKAVWYRNLEDQTGLHTAEVIQGKVLSYNNILDLDAACSLVQNFFEPAAVAVKHNNPCGVAAADVLSQAVNKALKADPISVFGGIIAVNREITATEAEILKDVFLECVVAPSFTDQAREIFSKKKNLRILQWPQMAKGAANQEIKSVSGGFLIQQKDAVTAGTAHWKLVSTKTISEIPAAVIKDLIFAEKVAASLKSNAIALVKNGQTVGLGMGQVNRVEAVSHAIDRMKHHFGELQDVVMASDAFFPFADSVEKAAQAGITWIIQPGGSLRDEEVFLKAKELKVNMVLTGERHFKH